MHLLSAESIDNVRVHCNSGRDGAWQIWDTAGQERYHEVSTNLTRTADGIIFVYDVMERNSFRRVRHWIQSAQKVSSSGTTRTEPTAALQCHFRRFNIGFFPQVSCFLQARGDGAAFSVPVVVFGNKCDLHRGADEKAGDSSPARQVSFEEGYSWAKAIGAKFQETSAFDGTGVHRGFHDIIDAATRRKRAVTLFPHPPARGRHGATHGPKAPLIPDEEDSEETGSCWCPWLCCCSQTQTND